MPCQKQRVEPCIQKIGSLHDEKVLTPLQFSHIGIDFDEPINVKEGSSAKKANVCVFTCALSRMACLELTNGLTTDEFVPAFSRTTNRRGLCQGGQTMQITSKPKVERLRSCMISQKSHRASRCWSLWIKSESSQSYQLRVLSGESS